MLCECCGYVAGTTVRYVAGTAVRCMAGMLWQRSGVHVGSGLVCVLGRVLFW